MSEIGSTIWQVPAYLPYLQPELTDDAIAAAEKAIGYSLPSEYLALLRVQNGGYIRLSLPDMVHDTIAGIGPHFPSLTDFVWDECKEYVSYPLSGLVPFDGDGHWHLCLDYRKNQSDPSRTSTSNATMKLRSRHHSRITSHCFTSTSTMNWSCIP